MSNALQFATDATALLVLYGAWALFVRRALGLPSLLPSHARRKR